MSRKRAAAAWCLACSAMLASHGCKAAPAVVPPAEREFVLTTQRVREPLRAGSFYAEQPARWRYEIVEGEDIGTAYVIRRASADRFDAQWADEQDDGRVSFWRHAEDGSIILTATIDHKDHAISIFDPPLLIAPATLAPGQALTSESSMRVVDLRDEAVQRESGTAIQTIEHLGGATIRTPMGEFDVAVVRSEFTAKLTFAEARSISTMYLAPGIGLVAEDAAEQVAIFGMRSRERTRTMVITTSTPPPAIE